MATSSCVPSRLTGDKQRYGRSPTSGQDSQNKIYHTVTACCRCRQRKTRCDPGLPRCDPCERSNARCEYFDTTKNRTIPRTYITQLQKNVRRLQQELAGLEKEDHYLPDAEQLIRGGGHIKFGENDESRFLGPSSGIAITRLVMELAKQNTDTKSIKEIVPDTTAQEIKHKFDIEKSKPTSKVYPEISDVAAPELPNLDLIEKLVDIYCAKAQYMLPLLHEPSFRQDVQDVLYRGSSDATKNFQLRMVIAISMQKLDTQWTGLADSYYLAALPYLEAAVRKADISTLQCYCLIAQYSMVTPTRTASYWVVGLATKLAHELGLTDEATIEQFGGKRFNTLEVDLRRRLSWIVTSMEYGLAHSLGRPNAFSTTVDHINVEFFALVDDRFITRGGILPGGEPIMKKCISIHFFKMRLLQAEIRRKLYLKKRSTPADDRDPWFAEMQRKIDHWVTSCPKNDEGSGLSEAWFIGRKNTIMVMLYRPSPQIPEPSSRAAHLCYDACVFNIALQREQIRTKAVDITWIFAQALFMALNTILWSLSYPSIRQEHPIEEVEGHLAVAMESIELSAERWPGVYSAIQLYQNLISGCLKAYQSGSSFVVHSPSNKTSPGSTQDIATPPSTSSPSMHSATSAVSATDPHYSTPSQPRSLSANRLTPEKPSALFGYVIEPDAANSQPNTAQTMVVPSVSQAPQIQVSTAPQQNGYVAQPSFNPYNDFSQAPFDPNSHNNPFPSVIPGFPHWDPSITSGSTVPPQAAFVSPIDDQPFWLGSFGDEYSRYLQQPFNGTPLTRGLSQQEQSEMMANFEKTPLPDVSRLINESKTFYTVDLP